jgi:hypothetical protein
MARIRPSIYIGIGGTGINAVAKTKKMFEDAYGDKLRNMPIQFVCIDYDLSTQNSEDNSTSISDDYVVVETNADPIDLYMQGSMEGDYKWFFKNNTRYMDHKVSNGAKQVRTYGRFLSEMIMPDIKARLNKAYLSVTNIASTITKDDIEGNVDLTAIDKVDCHLVMSIAGGTGCGSFLNIAWALRELFNSTNVNVIGYGVLHNVFCAMDSSRSQTPNVKANTYSALLDLDYLMTTPSPTTPVNISFNGVKTQLIEPLFDQFYAIDNVTAAGFRIKDVNTLCEALSLSLFSNSGEAGDKVQSILSNVEWELGNYDIKNKKGWVQGLGACELVYNGHALADLLADKVSLDIVKTLRLTSTDMQAKATTWTEENHVREDGSENNLLIDSLFKGTDIEAVPQIGSLNVEDSIPDVKNKVKAYLEKMPGKFPTTDSVAVRIQTLCDKLDADVNAMVNKEKGVGSAKEFLASLKAKFIGFKNEMETESADFDQKYNNGVQDLEKSSYVEYEKILNKFFCTKNTKQLFLDSHIVTPAQSILQYKLESERRKFAKNIFAALIAKTDDLIDKVNDLYDTLGELERKYANLIEEKTSSQVTSVFTIDISEEERLNMTLEDNEYNIAKFFESLLDKDGQATSLLKLDDVDKSIRLFAHNQRIVVDENNHQRVETTDWIQRYNQFHQKTIAEVIEAMSDTEYDLLRSKIDRVSSRLLELADKGQRDRQANKGPVDKMVKKYFICHHAADSQIRFATDNRFFLQKDTTIVNIDSLYYKQRMIFYRADVAVIPYCLASVDRFMLSEYENNVKGYTQGNKAHPHVDQILFDDMKKADHKLEPGTPNEAMFYWTAGTLLDLGWEPTIEKAQIMVKNSNNETVKLDHEDPVKHYKFIRFKAKRYEVYNPEREEWVSLHGTSRDRAFNEFKTEYLPELKSAYQQQILKLRSQNGIGKYKAIIDELFTSEKGTAGQINDYIDLVAIANKNSATLRTGNAVELEFYKEEVKYIKNQLINDLDNL